MALKLVFSVRHNIMTREMFLERHSKYRTYHNFKGLKFRRLTFLKCKKFDNLRILRITNWEMLGDVILEPHSVMIGVSEQHNICIKAYS